MTSVGIDLAATTGFAQLVDGKLMSFGHVKAITCADIEAIADLCTGAHQVAIESQFVGASSATSLKLATLRGRLCHALDLRGIDWLLVAPSTWRKHTIKPPAKTKRKALKLLAKAFAKETYGVDDVSEDEADAICLVTHLALTTPSKLAEADNSFVRA